MADAELPAPNARPISTTPIPPPQSNGEPVVNGESGPPQQAPPPESVDVEMKDEPIEPSEPTEPTEPTVESAPAIDPTASLLQPQAPAAFAPAPAPVQAATSPAATPTHARSSPHPAPPANVPAPPANPYPHGSPSRVYLNQHITPYLLEAMKLVVTHEPEKPLKYLSDFLAEKSRELEGT